MMALLLNLSRHLRLILLNLMSTKCSGLLPLLIFCSVKFFMIYYYSTIISLDLLEVWESIYWFGQRANQSSVILLIMSYEL